MTQTPRMRRLLRAGLGLMTCLAPISCNTTVPWVTTTPDAGTMPPAPQITQAPKQVKTGGACLELGEAQQPAVTREQFVQKIGTLLDAQRTEAAQRWVRRYPDVALDALRHTSGPQVGNSALLFIAQVHDEHCMGKTGADGWHALLQARAADPGRYTVYDTARQQYMALLREGRVPDATTVPLLQNAHGTLMTIDALRLKGEALLLAGKPAEAVSPLTDACQRAQNLQPYQGVQISLLLGEAYRRAGKAEQAAAVWQQAVLSAGQLQSLPQPVMDPSLWERAAYLRPVQCGWPDMAMSPMAPAGSAVVQAAATAPKTDVAEAWLWAKVGQWRLDRGEPHAALVAFKRAEALAMEQAFRDQLQLSQAKAMVDLNQPVAAMTVLVPLTTSPRADIAAPAYAMLGALRLKEGNSQMALAMLKRAVEQGPATGWPGRADAQADLGLAYLLCGDEANGLRCLHEAQQAFMSANALGSLKQCLDNEARYLEQRNRKEEASAIRQRLLMLSHERSTAG